ncbi:MAG: alcohol dehydrogenase catalytic domain-containing protein [Chloroflexota bacterium]|nr:alcohol dehydrogenase catalytic domain-containing protein [Chloroflexota bacterium]
MKLQMQAAILTEPNTPFRIETVTLDPPQRGEVLVKIAASGVCRSDWRVAIGTAPKPMLIITGREGAGLVEAGGDDHAPLSPEQNKRSLRRFVERRAGTRYYCVVMPPSQTPPRRVSVNATS